MFSLIIGVISVVLVVAIAVATMFYGGSVFGNGASSAKATQLAAETEQIRAAIQLFQNDHNRLPTSIEELTDDQKYLKGVPASGWASNAAFIQTSKVQVEEDVCLIFNKRRGISFVPACTDENYRDQVACCRSEPDPNQ